MLDCFLRSPEIVKCRFDLRKNSKKFIIQRSLTLLELEKITYNINMIQNIMTNKRLFYPQKTYEQRIALRS